MGLQKTKELKSGVSGDYWNIKEVVLSGEGKGYAVLAFYLDKNTRDDESKTYLSANTQVKIDLTKQELKDKDILAGVYEKIKEDNFFSDSVDVLED